MSAARLAAAAALAVALLFAAACGPRRYEGVGVVQDVRADLRQLVLDHEDIEGLMPAMTMSFDVADAALLEGVASGDRVRFELTFDGDSYRIVRLERIGAAGEAGVSGGGLELDAVAPEAELAPAFELVDQEGRAVSLASLRGKVVLLDFVYTRCPGPCPLLTSTHVRVQKKLPEGARGRVRFVSVSLDPERDTPEAMRAYALARGADLASWSLLTGPKEVVEAVLRAYGVGASPQPDGEIQHIVVTFLIDAEGRIAKRWFGLEHDADTKLRDVVAAARAAPAPAG
jgi:protein SCO1/2